MIIVIDKLGVKRLSQDLKLMLGKKLSLYWTICFLFLTPAFTLVNKLQ